MKNLHIFILGLILGIGLLIGCKKEDTSINNSQSGGGATYIQNHIEIADSQIDSINNIYELNQGFIVKYDKLDSNALGYEYKLVLASSGLIFYDSGVDLDSIEGIGHIVLIRLNSSISNEPLVGNYTYDINANGLPGKFNEALILINDTFTTTSSGHGNPQFGFDNLINGTLSITQTGNNYEINFYSTHSDLPGATITFYYNGFIKYLQP